jgi:hypothetical protein
MGRGLHVSIVLLVPPRIALHWPLGSRTRPCKHARLAAGHPYLECQPRLHLVLQHVRDCAIEVGQDLHRQLRVDAGVRDEVIEGVCESGTDAVQSARGACLLALAPCDVGLAGCGAAQCTCYGGKARSIAARWTPSYLSVWPVDFRSC